MSKKDIQVALVLTSGAVIGGQIRSAGYEFDTNERDARKWLHRGKARLNTAQPDTEDDGEKALADHTKAELEKILKDYGVEIEGKPTKADLIALIEKHEADLGDEGE